VPAGAKADSAREARALRARADRAFAAADWSDAVLALDALLELDPGDVDAQERLTLAATRFREQRELAEQWRQAVASFNDGDYRGSLRILYRLPPSEDQALIKRYTVAGWYNLGVRALQERDCRTALENLREAEALAPRDTEVRAALRLAQTCPRERATTSFGLALDRLPLRAVTS
jgi:tetratricopeptide (TPR) repeat protein